MAPQNIMPVSKSVLSFPSFAFPKNIAPLYAQIILARGAGDKSGARRGGLEKLRANDLRERAGGGLEVHLLEKGGKHRWARVNPNSEAIVREYFDRARERGEDALVFPKGTLSNRVDIHACRAEYARDMYSVYELENCENGDLYICRNERKGEIYDKGILMLVSRGLGHSRSDVVVNHYMR